MSDRRFVTTSTSRRTASIIDRFVLWTLTAFLFLSVMSASWAGGSETEGTRGVNVIDPKNASTPEPEPPKAEVEPELENAAGLSIEILPREQIEVGSKIVFKVSAKKQGYLILIDVDAHGHVSQIYPNLYSVENPGNVTMALPHGASPTSNFLKPGKDLLIPDINNPFARFEYVIEPPVGKGMVIALLSDKPVHMVDIPDIPADSAVKADPAHYVYAAAKTLRLAEPDAQLVDPQWSFEAKTYSISE